MGKMTLLNFKNLDKVLIIGPVYDQGHILKKCYDLLPKYDLIVFNGNLTYPLDQFKTNFRLQAMSDLLKTGKVIYNISGLDYKLSVESPQVAAWLNNKPNAVKIQFNRGTCALVVSGGITPKMKENKDLLDNLELSFVNNINEKPWHYSYNGRFGYVISNNLISNEPQFFNYSAQIGIQYNENKVFGQEVYENGLGDTFLL